MRDRIVSYLKKNRVSTTEVADAMSKEGALRGVGAINLGDYRVGRIRCIFAANESNYDVHEQIKAVEPGEVVLIFAHNCGERAIFGDLVSKFLAFYKEAEAVVVDGLIRDVAAVRRERYPVWSKGVTPIGCFNKKAEAFPEDLRKKLTAKYKGGVAVCDDGGVVIIEGAKLNEEMLERLKKIEMQEDLWFFCLDSLKWDTQKIVCDKDYLTETELIPNVYIQKLAELSKSLDN